MQVQDLCNILWISPEIWDLPTTYSAQFNRSAELMPYNTESCYIDKNTKAVTSIGFDSAVPSDPTQPLTHLTNVCTENFIPEPTARNSRRDLPPCTTIQYVP